MIHITINGTEKFCLAHINSTKSAFLCGEPAHGVIANYKFNFLRESVLCALSVTAKPCHLSQSERQGGGRLRRIKTTLFPTLNFIRRKESFYLQLLGVRSECRISLPPQEREFLFVITWCAKLVRSFSAAGKRVFICNYSVCEVGAELLRCAICLRTLSAGASPSGDFFLRLHFVKFINDFL